MRGRVGDILLGAVLLGALWYWLQYVAWGGVRYQRRAAWLRPATMRRVLRSARRKDRALDREIRTFLRGVGSGRAGRNADRTRSSEPGTLKRQPGPTHRRPGRPT